MKTPSLPLFVCLLALWGLAATAAGAVHLLVHLSPLAVPALAGGSTVALTMAVFRAGWIRETVRQISLRQLLGFHLLRFVGFYFLWLHVQGRLPVEFADRAGWGDIAAAAGALVLLAWPEGRASRRLLLAWNVIGLADLFVAVGTAGWLNVTRPGAMIEFSGLPLALVPLWAVPMLMASHFVVFQRLRGQGRATSSTGHGTEAVA